MKGDEVEVNPLFVVFNHTDTEVCQTCNLIKNLTEQWIVCRVPFPT